MVACTKNRGDLLCRALAAMASILRIVLVVAASAMPKGLERCQFIVYGCAVILAVLATALVLRAVHGLGLSNALKIAASYVRSSPFCDRRRYY